MPGPRESIGLVWLSAIVLGLLSAVAVAQTSLNDVHVIPRHAPTAANRDGSPIQLAKNSILPVIRKDVHLVLVPVSVTDPMQRLVSGLNKDNFQIFDNKKRQTIKDFSGQDGPVSLGLILDMSRSMLDKVDRVRDAVNEFCETANPQDEFFMIVFSNNPWLAVDFTSSTNDLEKELLFLQPKGRTALLDAIQMGLLKMKDAQYARRALLIVSDGGDNHSRHTEKDVKELAEESNVMIYSVGVFDSYAPTYEELLGPALLSEIVAPTGGRAYTLDDVNEMPAVARHIGMELRTQYVLAYRPNDLRRRGKWHRIKVTLQLPKRFPFLRAHAPAGYYPDSR